MSLFFFKMVHDLYILMIVSDSPSAADKVRKAVSKTVVTKRVVNLFLKNMGEHDEQQAEK